MDTDNHTTIPVQINIAANAVPTPASDAAARHAGTSGRILGRDTDSYSDKQFAKAAVPRSQWNASDAAKRASGQLPTRCGCTKLTVSVTSAGNRCYFLSIPHDTICVEPLKDLDAVTAIKVIVPNLDAMKTREYVEFDPICDVSFKPVSEGMITRKLLLSITQRPGAPKAVSVVEDKPVSELDEAFPRDADNQPSDDPTARKWGSAWQSIRTAYATLGMQQYCPPTVSEHDHEHIILKVDSLKELEHLTNTEIGELFVRNCMEIKGMAAPATTKPAPITKEAWTNFLTANKIDAEEMLCALDVDRLSEFTGTLDQALAAFNNFVAIDKAQHDAETAGVETAPTTPASASNAVAGPVAPVTPNDATAGKFEPQTGRATAAFSAEKKTIRKENTIKVSGQDYLKAQGRVTLWKHDHPDWSLETETVSIMPDFAVFKACIKDSNGKIVATGHGFCTPTLAQKVSGRFVEKAETAAVARALAFAGYGTDDTLDDSDYISDSPRAA